MMNKYTEFYFKKQYTRKTKFLKIKERIEVIRGLIQFESFNAYHMAWMDKSKRNHLNILLLDIVDVTPFTIKDYEFILWYGFVNMYGLVDSPTVKYRVNQRMTLDIFDSQSYALYLSSILTVLLLTPNHILFDYIQNKRLELVTSDRQYTLKKIMKS